MRKISVMLLTALTASTLFLACKKSENDSGDVSKDTLDKIASLGFSTQGVTRHEDGYLVEGDIILTEENLTGLPATHELIYAKSEHYRTTSIVTGTPRTITVSLNTSQANFVAAVDEAIRRYNALGLSLTFQKVSGTRADINVKTFYQVSNTLGSAGFPTKGGRPYGTINMNLYWYNSGVAVNALATTIAHEMGHCIGFRHTDYMDRSYSCGGAFYNEGTSSYGAVHIPGTPTGPSANSWMLACGSTANNFDRPFTSADQTALTYVY
jgi:Dual-action HEIGH metallo-peptidase